MKHETFFAACERLARAAQSKGNPAVGAVVTQRDEIVGSGEEAAKSRNDVTCHAEIEAIRKAVLVLNTSDLSGCTLYTTHEPCIMCSYVIRFYRIAKVFYRKPVEYLGGISSNMPLLTAVNVPPHWSAPPEISLVTTV
jgi:tRNA(adenine34) deaminase